MAIGPSSWWATRPRVRRSTIPYLSKDMHVALARDGAVVAEGLPGPDFARHMLSVDPPDHTRLRGLAATAFSPGLGWTALEPRIKAIAAELLDDLAARGPVPVDLVAGYAGPLPFAVIGGLLGIERADQRRLSGWFATLLAPYSGAAEPPPEAVAASDHIVRLPRRSRRQQVGGADQRPGWRPGAGLSG